MRITIQGRLDGLNEYTLACRTNRYAGAKLKRDNERVVLRQLPSSATRFSEPVDITFTWYEKDRRRDIDNVAFAKKFILDALVQAGVLEGDNQRHVRAFRDIFEVDPKNPRIEIDIEPHKF